MSDQMNPNKGNQNPWNRSVLGGEDGLPVHKDDANPYAAWKRPVTAEPPREAPYTEPTAAEEPSFRQMGSDAPTRVARPVGAQQMVNKRKTVERPLSATPVTGGDKPDFTRGTAVPELPLSPLDAVMTAPRTVEQRQPAPTAQRPTEPQAAPARPRPAAQRPSADPAGAPTANHPQQARPAAPRPAAPNARPAAPSASPARTAMPRPAAPNTRPAAQSAAPARPAMPRPAASEGERPVYAENEAPSELPRRRRSTRYLPEGEAQPAAPAGYAPTAPGFDPFQAGDSEAAPQRRPAGDQRYTGARTAMPQGGAGARPRPAQRPQAEAPAARRMAQPDARDPRYAYEDEQSAPAPRQRYPYEDLPAEEEEPPRRRGGPLVVIVIILLVLSAALAAICLPDWANIGGGVGTTMNTVKTGVIGVFDKAKNAIFPAKETVTSFSVSPTEVTAPAELVFSVQTSTAVHQLRVLDDNGNVVAAMSDMDAVGGEVTQNSSFTLWTLRTLCENAYTGLFTVQTLGRDGTWDEGLASGTAVSVAAPVAAAPAAQSFNCDTTSGEVPAEIYFSVVTSAEVAAVQVVDDSGAVVTGLTYEDPNASIGAVLDGTETRTWSLNAFIESPYTGRYLLRTLKDGDLDYETSDYVVAVDFAATPEITATPTLAPTATPEPTPEPTPTVEPTPSPTPAPTLLPALDASADASADPSAIGLKATLLSELKTVDSFDRTKAITINDPFNYAVWQQSGVLTFRGGPFRQNAAYGVADITQEKLAEAWKVAVEGSIKTSSGAVYGVSWPGQAAIVKWPTEVRRMMNLTDEKKETTALKEVIVAAQNGSIYFLDLNDGTATRDAIQNKWPSNGSVSVATNASPILAVGQMYGKLSGKNVDNGLHLYNLLNCEQIALINGREKPAATSYSGVSGSPIFDKATGAMIVGAQNGLLYTMELNDEFDYLAGRLKIKPTTQRYKIVSNGQKAKNTNIDGSVAMYGSYVYYGDQYGTLQCVDVNTLTPVWAVATGDCIDATPALDMENDATVSLYTGNMIFNKSKDGACVIRKYDALTGEEKWSYTVEGLSYNKKLQVGCVASPVVGQNAISDLVIFTVTNADTDATMIALNKTSGNVEWSLGLSAPSVSSPVAVYNEAGDAWLIQAAGDGKLHLIAAKSGQILDTLQLTGDVEASPAVYRDMLVISTTGKDGSYIYGVKLQ